VSGYRGEAFLLDYTDATGMRVIEPVVLPAGYERDKGAGGGIPSPDGDVPGNQNDGKDANDDAGAPEEGAPEENSDDSDTEGTDDTNTDEPTDTGSDDAGGEDPDGDVDDADGDDTDETDGEETSAVSPSAMPRSRARIRARALESLALPDKDGYLPLRGHKLG